MAKLSRKEALRGNARRVGLYVAVYSPGDGVSRFRFFKGVKPRSFFTADGIYTALGISEAETFTPTSQLPLLPSEQLGTPTKTHRRSRK